MKSPQCVPFQLFRFSCATVLALLAALSCPSARAADEPAVRPQSPAVSAEQIQSLRSKAYQFQKDEQWCEAVKVWTDLSGRLSNRPDDARYQDEARQNIRLLEPLCRPKKKPVSEIAVSAPPASERPPAVPREHLLKYYPVGKKVRSVTLSNISGRGSNEDWIFEGTAKFTYQSRVAIESRVIENDGSKLVAELYFREVAQTNAVSNEELQLRMPDLPLLSLVFEQLEEEVLRYVPIYVVVRKVADIGLTVDPRAKRTLTWFAKQLRKNGVPIVDADEIELLTRVDKLDGMRLKFEYVSGLGVTKIEVLDDKKFDPDDLERLAYNFSLLLEYYIFPGAVKQPGERWDVRAEDVVGLLGLGYDAQATGKLTLERGNNRKVSNDGTQAVLRLVSGEARVTGARTRRGQEATIKTRSGTAYYSPQDLLVRQARITWGASTTWFSTDHLLFGTVKLRNLKMETYYEAKRVE